MDFDLLNIGNIVKKNVVYYESAMKQLKTYIDMINDEFTTMEQENPINHVKTRIKSADSILDKLIRKNMNITKIEELSDIVGARIVVDFIDNIYVVLDKIKSNKNIKIIEEKDYIKKPKSSGYRGYHIIIEIPIYVEGNGKNIKCEIQIRTLGIDTWASNEHKLNYKKEKVDEESKKVLKETAKEIWDVDLKLNELYRKRKNQNVSFEKVSIRSKLFKIKNREPNYG